jgi:hypothetical protein
MNYSNRKISDVEIDHEASEVILNKKKNAMAYPEFKDNLFVFFAFFSASYSATSK